jgi:probable addiction module antidote protein
MTTMTRPLDAAEYLDSPETIAAYLADALTDTPEEFLEALGVVARAVGMSRLAEEAGVTRPALYRSLSSSGNPEFRTVMRVLDTLGVTLQPALKQPDVGIAYSVHETPAGDLTGRPKPRR